MNNRFGFGTLVRWLFMLAVPFMLLAGSVRLLLSHQFLRLEYQRAGFPADPYGFTTVDRLEYGMWAIDYLFQAGASASLAELRLPRQKCWRPPGDAAECRLFNENELRHLADVKQIVSFISALATVNVIAIAAALIAARSNPDLQRQISAGSRRGATLTLAAMLMLTVVAAAAWDSAFDRFHEIFFAAGTWRFLYSDSLIRLYPEQLFVDAALVIGALSVAGALVILLLVPRGDSHLSQYLYRLGDCCGSYC